MPLSDCISSTYREARAKFLLICENYRLNVDQNRNHAVRGVSGEALYTDIAVIGGADASKVLIISSGTHGVEGYCGSALQLYALEQGLHERIAADCVCYIVHAVNPYGFSYHRRVNEDNVDLNRNFIDFTQPLPANPDYQNLKNFMAEHVRDIPGRTVQDAVSAYMEKYGEQRYREAVTSGQYTDEADIYFGGRQAAWSNAIWKSFLNRAVLHATHVIHIDIHTGLGPYGKQTLIYTCDPAKPAFQMACECYGKDNLLLPGAELTPNVNGPIAASFNHLSDKTHVIGVASEFGTVALREMLGTLTDENSSWGADSSDSDDRQDMIDRMRQCFCPDDPGWADDVWVQFDECLERSIGYLKNIAPSNASTSSCFNSQY